MACDFKPDFERRQAGLQHDSIARSQRVLVDERDILALDAGNFQFGRRRPLSENTRFDIHRRNGIRILDDDIFDSLARKRLVHILNLELELRERMAENQRQRSSIVTTAHHGRRVQNIVGTIQRETQDRSLSGGRSIERKPNAVGIRIVGTELNVMRRVGGIIIDTVP